MNKSNIPLKDLILVGGGHSHAIVLKMFAMNPMPGLRITLLSSVVDTPYSGMLPGLIAGHFSFDECHIDLRAVCEVAGVIFIQSKVESIDYKQQQVICSNRPPISFDLLSINIGSTPDYTFLKSGKELVNRVKPIEQFLPILDKLIKEKSKHLVVVGGGAGGVELALSLNYKLNIQAKKQFSITLLNANESILSQHNDGVRKKVEQLFKRYEITLINQANVNEVKQDSLQKKISYIDRENSEQLITADYIIWATSASAPKWLQETGLSVDQNGFIQVNNFLQSVSHENTFAAGDIATIGRFERPKSGVFAVRQGMPLYQNLRLYLLNSTLKPHYPQEKFLSLLNCGEQQAIASWSFLAISGRWLWFFKRWIDQSFMNKFAQLSLDNMAMKNDDLASYSQIANEEELEHIKHIDQRCGGCGAKVGASVLSRVLERIQSSTNDTFDATASQDDIYFSMKDKEDAAVFNVPENKLLVQSIDYFRSFISDPFILGQIAVVHALGDIYAMGAKPHSAQVLASLPYMGKEKQEESLFQLMSGVVKKLSEDKVTLLGGHTNESAEMGCGLTVNGLIDKNLPQQHGIMSKGGLRIGQKLILTKPLGTGVLLAANMLAKAKGRWVENCLHSMMLSNAKASQLFVETKSQSCTDMTGFGLIGHLSEMLNASNCAASLSLSKLPVLDGVKDCIADKVSSSLYSENERYQAFISPQSIKQYQQHPLFPLLFDPQTAGGLLCGVDEDKAEETLKQLRQNNYLHANIIGSVVTLEDNQDYKVTIHDE